MSVARAFSVVMVAAAGLCAGCQGGFPKCGGSDCPPCLDCDQLIGSYEGWMTNFKNDCLDDLDPQVPDQPWGISISEILYDESSDSTYLQFDYTDLGYGIVEGTLCGPKEKKGEKIYDFCMNFSYDSMFSANEQDMQTTHGAFIEDADGAVRFEGMVHNLLHDPINGGCHVKATATAEKSIIE